MSRYLHCDICDKGIEVWDNEEFHYTQDGRGPYCDHCWAFMEEIDSLRQRVERLENPPGPYHKKKQPTYLRKLCSLRYG